MFNKEKNVIYACCVDTPTYNMSGDVMYEFIDYMKSLGYNTCILHGKENFGKYFWKITPKTEIKYLSTEIVMDDNDVLLIPAESVPLMYSAKDLKAIKIGYVTDPYSFIPSSMVAVKTTAAIGIKTLGVQKVISFNIPTIKHQYDMKTLLKSYFVLTDDDIIDVTFSYCNPELYNAIAETITTPEVKELPDGQFTVEDIVTTKERDIDVLIKFGNAVNNSLLGYLVNTNDNAWVIDFVDYNTTEEVKIDKLKRAKVFVDFPDEQNSNNFDKSKASFCGCYILQYQFNSGGFENFKTEIQSSIGKKYFISPTAEAHNSIDMNNLEGFLNDATCTQEQTSVEQ